MTGFRADAGARGLVVCCDPGAVWSLQATQSASTRPGPDGAVPPAALPPTEWTFMSWVGVALYVTLFFLAAWWIYRLADLDRPDAPGGPAATP